MSADCLRCQLAKARREHAILTVPKEVPNPAIADAIRKDKPIAGKRLVYGPRGKNGQYGEPKAVGWALPKTVPNPAFDRLVFDARMMPEECDLHRALFAARIENAIGKGRAQRERLVEAVGELKRLAKATGARPEVSMRYGFAE